MSDPRYLPGGITDRDLDGPAGIPEYEICHNCGHEHGYHHQGGGCFWINDEHDTKECECEGFSRRPQPYYDGEPDDDVCF